MYTTGQVYSQQLTPPWYRRLIGEKAIPSQIVKVTKLDGFNPMENNSMDLSQYVVTNNPDKVPKWFIDKVKAMQTGKGSTYINDNIIADK
jgi:hypothetical protein